MPLTENTEIRLRLAEAIAPAMIREWHRHGAGAPSGAQFGKALADTIDAAHRAVLSGVAQK